MILSLCKSRAPFVDVLGHVSIGAGGTMAQEGAQGPLPPFCATIWGDVPANLVTYVLVPFDSHLHPFHRK